jgi:hypothetical protein
VQQRSKLKRTKGSLSVWVTERKVNCNCRDPEPLRLQCNEACQKAWRWVTVLGATGALISGWVLVCVAG